MEVTTCDRWTRTCDASFDNRSQLTICQRESEDSYFELIVNLIWYNPFDPSVFYIISYLAIIKHSDEKPLQYIISIIYLTFLRVHPIINSFGNKSSTPWIIHLQPFVIKKEFRISLNIYCKFWWGTILQIVFLLFIGKWYWQVHKNYENPD